MYLEKEHFGCHSLYSHHFLTSRGELNLSTQELLGYLVGHFVAITVLASDAAFTGCIVIPKWLNAELTKYIHSSYRGFLVQKNKFDLLLFDFRRQKNEARA